MVVTMCNSPCQSFDISSILLWCEKTGKTSIEITPFKTLIFRLASFIYFVFRKKSFRYFVFSFLRLGCFLCVFFSFFRLVLFRLFAWWLLWAKRRNERYGANSYHILRYRQNLAFV